MMFKNGVDQGYKASQTWWDDPHDPDCHRYADPDIDYPIEYFPLADPGNAKEFVDIVLHEVTRFTGKGPQSIVEFGSGGGWYLKEFQDRKLSIHGYEGSAFGVASCLEKGIANFNIDVADFRYPMERKFKRADVVICTEVAEHVDPPFHGTLAHNLIAHGNLIWFSSEPPDTNRPHLHHPGERPQGYWTALFDFLGFGCYMLPNEVHTLTNERGRCLFYNREMYKP